VLTILLHSSKTMRPPGTGGHAYQAPMLLDHAEELARYVATLSPAKLQTSMQLSKPMAQKTHDLVSDWTSTETSQRPAIDAFLGDIYSGLQSGTFSNDDRDYANKHLFILSGLYGVLRALDGIYPYRLEMGYRFPSKRYANLYDFWGDSIAKCLPVGADIINLSAVEYTKAVLPHLPDARVVTPKFMTISPKTGEPTFVTVHAKVARGAFARWLIQQRVESVDDITAFGDIGYSYDPALSTKLQPVFVCKEFGGIGLSVRLTR
jgi:cytoplasmic iron level regulating protein YaaA (DUF328/UPF0246 family)